VKQCPLCWLTALTFLTSDASKPIVPRRFGDLLLRVFGLDLALHPSRGQMATLKCLGPFARDEHHAKSRRLRILEVADGATCPGLFAGIGVVVCSLSTKSSRPGSGSFGAGPIRPADPLPRLFLSYSSAPREACPRRRKELPPGRQNGHEDLQLANPLQPGDSNGNSSRADDCVRQPETLNQQGLFRKAAR
jgi:hypothetical protein